MAMKFDRFTEKTQEALVTEQALARDAGRPRSTRGRSGV